MTVNRAYKNSSPSRAAAPSINCLHSSSWVLARLPICRGRREESAANTSRPLSAHLSAANSSPARGVPICCKFVAEFCHPRSRHRSSRLWQQRPGPEKYARDAPTCFDHPRAWLRQPRQLTSQRHSGSRSRRTQFHSASSDDRAIRPG